MSSLKVYRSKVVVTDEHFFPIAVDDLVDALAGIERASNCAAHRATPSFNLNTLQIGWATKTLTNRCSRTLWPWLRACIVTISTNCNGARMGFACHLCTTNTTGAC